MSLKLLATLTTCMFVTAWSGCVGATDLAPTQMPDAGPCDHFPEREELTERWGPFASSRAGARDGVSIVLQQWGNLDAGDFPALYVDWNATPIENRHPLISDLLCHAVGQIEQGRAYERYRSSVITADWLATEALESVKAEHHRQTGEWGWDEGMGYGYGCCYIMFAGYPLGTGCQAFAFVNLDGSYEETNCSYSD